MAEPQTPAPLTKIVTIAETCLDIVRDILLLAVVSIAASMTTGATMSIVALVVWAGMLAKYLGKALVATFSFQPVAERINSQKMRLAATCVTIAFVPFALLISSYAIQSQLRSVVAYIAALGR